MSNDPQCVNCGSDLFITDYARGNCHCAECGCVIVDQIAVSSGPCYDMARDRVVYAPPHPVSAICGFLDEGPLVQPPEKRHKSQPYRRETYFNERISQWRMNEPEIPYDDLDSIKWQWKSMYPEGDKLDVSKEECRLLLRKCDDQLVGWTGQRPYFVKKYLVSNFLF